MNETNNQRLGKYEILEQIGHGAHATVYKARDTTLDRIVALKAMRSGLLWEPDAVERCLREARAAAQLEHPHIVTIYEVGEAEGTYYIAMRYLPGTTVDKLIEQGPLPVEQAVDIARQVAEALGYGHQRGFIHRDVKPGNIIVSDAGFATLTDFGLVKALAWASLTSSGGAIGTPGYVAPELWEEKGATPATDVYALGVVLWEMLAGQRLFAGETPAGVMRKHLTVTPPPLAEVRADVPLAVAKVVARALEKRSEGRYLDGGDLTQALKRAVETKQTTASGPAETTTPPRGTQTEGQDAAEVAVRAADYFLWFWWVLGSTMGGFIGGAAVLAVVFMAAEAVGDAVFVPLHGPVIGAAVGTGQWLVLRRQIQKAGRWVLNSALGGAAGLAVVFMAAEVVERAGIKVVWSHMVVAMVGVVAGAAVGTGQWLVLRRQVQKAGWWVLSSALGGAAGLAVVFMAAESLASALSVLWTSALWTTLLWAVGWAVIGGMYGAFTGAVLILLYFAKAEGLSTRLV